ncbi:hypothetical protein [Streptomyces albus]
MSAQPDHAPVTPHAPAPGEFVASGYDDSDFIDMAELRRRRR